MPDRSPVSVHLLPAMIPPGALKGGVAVVLDVLRASTVMVHALAAGCEAVIPCLEVEEARCVASEFPPGKAFLGGERHGLPIPGFDLGNSPSAYTHKVCQGKTLVMTTTNGTRAILASLDADRVIIAAFANLRATVRLLKAEARPIHLVCSGTEGSISLEDATLAGVIATLLDDMGRAELTNDEAWIVASAARGIRVQDLLHKEGVYQLILHGRGGRRVREIGLDDDIRTAAEVDRFDLAIELRREPLRIVKAMS
jgi:2-phosphosulfolactate phosphatase